MKIGITERGDAALDLDWLLALQFKTVEGVIVITKDPSKLLGIDLPKNVIVHCTITGLGSFWEPNVPQTMSAVRSYQELVSIYGGDRVVLRIDPIIPYMPFKERPMSVLKFRKGRVRISFLDMYPHVRRRYLDISGQEFPLWKGLHAPFTERNDVLRKMEESGPIEVCGEPDFPCTGCVSKLDLVAMGLEDPISAKRYPEKGQRSYCPCLAVKKELLTNRHPCAHGCIYCYWKD
jgi:DNA repair photolyase